MQSQITENEGEANCGQTIPRQKQSGMSIKDDDREMIEARGVHDVCAGY
jgi:hypothetical protein